MQMHRRHIDDNMKDLIMVVALGQIQKYRYSLDVARDTWAGIQAI